MYASGFLFLSATEEQMTLVSESGIDHVAYVLIIYSLAFLTFLFTNVLVYLYDSSVNGPTKAKAYNVVNGHAPGAQGRGATSVDERRLRDVEEFELDGLMSDDEDEEQAQRRKLLKEGGSDRSEGDGEALSSPSTVGRNNDRVA